MNYTRQHKAEIRAKQCGEEMALTHYFHAINFQEIDRLALESAEAERVHYEKAYDTPIQGDDEIREWNQVYLKVYREAYRERALIILEERTALIRSASGHIRSVQKWLKQLHNEGRLTDGEYESQMELLSLAHSAINAPLSCP
jgi:hypothetical protein